MDLQQFTYEPARKIRAILNENGEPLFMAKDVCEVLGLENSRQAVSRLDDDDRINVTINDGIRGNPEKTFITESGLYNLIFTSTKPEAKKFKKWVTSDLLPTIRKTGKYDTANQGTDVEQFIGLQTNRDHQISNSKKANRLCIAIGGGEKAAIEYNRKNCTVHTGYPPHKIKEYGKQRGLKSKDCSSAKQVMRAIAPHVACGMSLTDELVVGGANQDTAMQIGKESHSLYAKILNSGFNPKKVKQ